MSYKGKWYNRGKALATLFAVLLFGMTGVCHANPIHSPALVAMEWMYLLMGPIVLFALAAGVFLGIRCLLSRERKESYFVREQFAIILLLIGGFLLSGFFVGIGLIAFGIWEAILMYREAFKPSGEELLGRKRAVNMIAAIVIMIPVYMFFLPPVDSYADVNDLLELAELFGFRFWEILLKMSQEVTKDSTLTSPVLVLNLSVLLGAIWLVAFLVMLFIRRYRGLKLRDAFLDGLAVFGYVIIGHCTLWLLVGLWFYYMAIHHGCRVMKKYLSEGMPQSGGDVTDRTVPGDTDAR